jgi:hypothetical protein
MIRDIMKTLSWQVLAIGFALAVALTFTSCGQSPTAPEVQKDATTAAEGYQQEVDRRRDNGEALTPPICYTWIHPWYGFQWDCDFDAGGE